MCRGVGQNIEEGGMVYETFVQYNDLDPFKKACQAAAAKTAANMEALGFKEIPWTRGESAYVFEHVSTGLLLAFVIEGLGTKNLIAEDPDLRQLAGRTYYDVISQCNLGMVVNDLISVGARPLVFGLHPALAEGDHLSNANASELIAGTFESCQKAACTWGPGETPQLRGVVMPGTMCLSGAGVGVVLDRKFLANPAAIKPGLSILMLGSSGIHSNGSSMCRGIAELLPKGYLTDVGNGQSYGEALLQPTMIYAPFVAACQDQGVEIVYGIPISGHGWRKLMRADRSFTYRVNELPDYQPIFAFIQEKGRVTTREMYGTFNMNGGYAILLPAEDVPYAINIAMTLGYEAMEVGFVEEGPRRVILEPINEIYTELDLRN